MNSKRFSPLQLIVAVVLAVVLSLGGVALTAWLVIGPDGLTMLEGVALIRGRFVGDYEETEMLDGAMNGMVDGLGDRWSHYLNPQEYENQKLRRANAYVGVGIMVSYDHEEGLLVVEVEPGGPAETAGMKVGDMIIEVEGQSIAGDARNTATELIRGEKGSTVSLTLRGEDGTQRTVSVLRAEVWSDPVQYRMLEGNVGYVRMDNFYTDSAKRVMEAVDDLAAQGAVALIFDMRNNPGGYLDQLTKLLDYLLPEGPIFATHSKNDPTSVTQSDENCVDLPMTVLVNGATYSAAELFAAQLRESVGATVVGTVTSGKGYSQQSYPLPNGGAMNISTGAYTTGGGLSLVGTGLIPDYEVTQTSEGDAPLERALALMKQK